MSQIRVLLVEDHVLVREGIRALLHSLEGIDVVAEANNGREALELIQKHQPDVVLMDIAMPGLNGLEAAPRPGDGWAAPARVMRAPHPSGEQGGQGVRGAPG